MAVEIHAATATYQLCGARSRLLPSGLQRRGLVCLHLRTPEVLLQCMRLEYDWRDFQRGLRVRSLLLTLLPFTPWSPPCALWKLINSAGCAIFWKLRG